jgi:methionine-rich copper-binding protein CopC
LWRQQEVITVNVSRVGVWSLGVALVLVPALGWTHAQLVNSKPARRSVLSRAPDRVTLSFNEPLEPAFARVSVWDADGKEVDRGDAQVGPDDPKILSVGLPNLPAGTYAIKFRVLSVDGHVVESEFPFVIRGGPVPPGNRGAPAGASRSTP